MFKYPNCTGNSSFDIHDHPKSVADKTSDFFLLELDSLDSSSASLMLQAHKTLETSASYMNEIESFFQELSSSSSTSNSNSTFTTGTATPINIPIHHISTPSLTFPINQYESDPRMRTLGSIDGDSTSPLLSAFDLESFGGFEGSAIDPSIFNNFTEQDDGEESHSDYQPFDHFYNTPTTSPNTSRSSSICNTLSISSANSSKIANGSSKRRGKTSRPQNINNNTKNTNTHNNTHGRPPKFYSRSGQVADPNRGPCHNCHTTLTCYWRKLKGQYHCNACTLFYKRNKFHRNGESVDKPIKRRNRKSKYSNPQQ